MSTIHFDTEHATIWHGDCIDVMRELPDASVDAVVTDPPYGLEFMGREWDGADGFRRSLNAADEGRDSVFGRMSAKAPEYRTDGKMLGQVSQNWSEKATHSRGYADHDANAFQAWCEVWAREALRVLKPGGHMLAFGGSRTFHRLACAIEDAGFNIRDSLAWIHAQGFPKNSAVLKPAFEPIIVARKPLEGTVAANVEQYGTGALNIDDCRLPIDPSDPIHTAQWAHRESQLRPGTAGFVTSQTVGQTTPVNVHAGGRWPANVILDESQAAVLDAQSGERTSGLMLAGQARQGKASGILGEFKPDEVRNTTYGDTGGASRFYFTAKADRFERPTVDGIAHPTVKPLDLMRWLVRLVTPKGGTVLEPFAGSGTTVEACVLEGFRCIAIEREADYLSLIMQRVSKPHAVGLDFDWEDAS